MATFDVENMVLTRYKCRQCSTIITGTIDDIFEHRQSAHKTSSSIQWEPQGENSASVSAFSQPSRSQPLSARAMSLLYTEPNIETDNMQQPVDPSRVFTNSGIFSINSLFSPRLLAMRPSAASPAKVDARSEMELDVVSDFTVMFKSLSSSTSNDADNCKVCGGASKGRRFGVRLCEA